jgi:hypothetical protein
MGVAGPCIHRDIRANRGPRLRCAETNFRAPEISIVQYLNGFYEARGPNLGSFALPGSEKAIRWSSARHVFFDDFTQICLVSVLAQNPLRHQNAQKDQNTLDVQKADRIEGLSTYCNVRPVERSTYPTPFLPMTFKTVRPHLFRSIIYLSALLLLALFDLHFPSSVAVVSTAHADPPPDVHSV